MKKQKDRKEKLCYFEMVILAILLALVITYGVLYLMLPLGSHGLFFGGAIVGGLWGNIWNVILFFDERLLQEAKLYSPLYIGFLIAGLVFVLFGLFVVYPLPSA